MNSAPPVVVLSAPSGSGKTTIARRLLEEVPDLRFSISATTREPRGTERHGEDYHFLSEEDFRTGIDEGAFVEWEEVYPGLLYGTLHSEIERIGRIGVPLLDIDVKGALNVKRQYGDRALTIFIQPPSISVLAGRLQGRGTDSGEAIAERLERARIEMSHAPEFDAIIINDDLDEAVAETVRLVREFLATGIAPRAQ